MDHKAFAFDWNGFQRHLAPVLHDALSRDATAPLATFIDDNRHSLTDPYEGDHLPDNWASLMENRDVQEHADFALTHYYDPTADFGIGESWMEFSDSFPSSTALLGAPFGPAGNLFDPGRMGSYFQSPEVASSSLRELLNVDRRELSDFVAQLERCEVEGMGLYVTF